jgi:hypothetical protein
MDADLKQYLDVKFTEVEVRFQSMDARMEAMEARLRQHVGIECEKVETKLLTEFHKWGRTSDMRTRQAITDTGLLGERMLAAEDRISALERQRGL